MALSTFTKLESCRRAAYWRACQSQPDVNFEDTILSCGCRNCQREEESRSALGQVATFHLFVFIFSITMAFMSTEVDSQGYAYSDPCPVIHNDNASDILNNHIVPSWTGTFVSKYNAHKMLIVMSIMSGVTLKVLVMFLCPCVWRILTSSPYNIVRVIIQYIVLIHCLLEVLFSVFLLITFLLLCHASHVWADLIFQTAIFFLAFFSFIYMPKVKITKKPGVACRRYLHTCVEATPLISA